MSINDQQDVFIVGIGLVYDVPLSALRLPTNASFEAGQAVLVDLQNGVFKRGLIAENRFNFGSHVLNQTKTLIGRKMMKGWKLAEKLSHEHETIELLRSTTAAVSRCTEVNAAAEERAKLELALSFAEEVVCVS